MRWLTAVGLIIGLLGALLRVIAALREEEHDRKGRTRVAITSVRDVDPTRIGVDPAPPQSILSGGEVPKYLSREIDGELDLGISEALSGTGRWIVVAVGSSKVGKSRALFEALRRCDGHTEVRLVAPVDFEALKALLAPGQLPELHDRASVLWLDDLEPFVDQGMTMQTLEEWRERFSRCVVVGTYGGKGSTLVTGGTDGDIGTITGEVRRRAREVRLGETTADEIDPLRSSLPPDVLAAVERHGLAAYLVAGPELATKLTTRRHRPGDLECPEGVAVVYAAVDWARAGRTNPISSAKLRELWPDYLPPGSHPTEDGFETGLAWALDPVAGSIALLEGIGGYRAYDYVLELVSERPTTQVHRDSIWQRALEDATDAQAFSVGVAAYFRGRFKDAAAGFEVAARSPADQFAALATVNLGVAFGELKRHEQEAAAYDEVLGRFGEAEGLELREQVGRALVNRGIMHGELGHSEQAVAAYDEVLSRFGDAEELVLREQVARALFNKGVRLVALDRQEQALAVYDEVVDRFGEAEEAELHEPVARALVNKGVRLGEIGHSEQAVTVYDEAVDRFGDAEELELREQVARALFNKGVRLGEIGHSEEAVAVYDEVVDRFGDAKEPALRGEVARALFNKGVRLGVLGRHEQAVAVYDEVIIRFGDAEELELREQVVGALVNKGVRLGELGRHEQAVTVYDEAVDRFGDAEELELREQVARALFNKGVRLGVLGRHEREIAVYDDVASRFGDVPEPLLREAVARALVNKGITLEALGRPEQAVAVYDDLINRFGDAEEPLLREEVQRVTEVLARRRQEAD